MADVRRTQFSTSFTQADGPLPTTDWDEGTYTEVHGDLTVRSNHLEILVSGVGALGTVKSVSLPGDQWGMFTLLNWAGGDVGSGMVALRFTAPPTVTGYFIQAWLNHGDYRTRISRSDDGVETELAGENATAWATSDAMLVTMLGTTLTAYRLAGGSEPPIEVLSTTDATHTGGRAGIDIYKSGTESDLQLDEFRMGDFLRRFLLSPC